MPDLSCPPVETRVGPSGDSYTKVLDLETWDAKRLTQIGELLRGGQARTADSLLRVAAAFPQHPVGGHAIALLQSMLPDPEVVLDLKAVDRMAVALQAIPDGCAERDCDLIAQDNGYCRVDHEYLGADPTPLTREELTTPDAVYGITNKGLHP